MICIANIVLFLLNGIKKSTYHSFFSVNGLGKIHLVSSIEIHSFSLIYH